MLVTCQKSQKLNQKNTFWPYDLARLQVSRLCNFSFNLNFLIRRSWCHLNNPIKSRFYFPRSERPKIWPTTLLWKFPFWFLYLANIDPESLELSPPSINHLHEDSTWWNFTKNFIPKNGIFRTYRIIRSHHQNTLFICFW